MYVIASVEASVGVGHKICMHFYRYHHHACVSDITFK